MAVYQSYGYGSEKTAVVFDVGHAYTKVGFVSENGPRSIIPSEVKQKKTNKVYRIYEKKDNEEELYDCFVDFFHVLYFRHLLVNPKERRVVLVESILLPTVFRDVIAKVLFKHYEVPSLVFAPSHLLSLFTLGIPSGLVMDVGYKETLVLPVYEGTPILKGWQSLPLAGQAIHNCLEATLLESATTSYQDTAKPLSSVMDKVEEKILEDIKVRCCFVTRYERAQNIQAVSQGKAEASEAPTPPPGVEYPIAGNTVLQIDGKIRENTCEVLFEQDNEEKSIATLLLDSILQCPVDTRRDLASHIVITGGTSMLPGFQHRLMAELKALVTRPEYQPQLSSWDFKFCKPPAKANYVAWLGGAIFGSLEILASRSITIKAYSEQPILPDWCSLFEPEDKEDKTLLALRTEKPVGTGVVAEQSGGTKGAAASAESRVRSRESTGSPSGDAQSKTAVKS